MKKILEKKVKAVDRYDFFGKTVWVESSDERILKRIRGHWNAFFSKEKGFPKVVFHFLKYPGPKPLQPQYFSNPHFLFLLDSKVLVTAQFDRKPWRLWIQFVDDLRDQGEIDNFTFVIFEPLLRHALKRLGLFQIHSAAVTKAGVGILLPGKKASGKTTTSLGLVRKNFKLVADDQVFLKKRKGSVYALGFPRDLSLTKESLSFFPELQSLKRASRQKKGDPSKYLFTLKRFQKIYPHRLAHQMKVNYVFFPYLTEATDAHAQPIPKSQALLQMFEGELNDYHHFLLKDEAVLRKQLDLYSTLCKHARTFNLTLGRTSDSVAEKILKKLDLKR